MSSGSTACNPTDWMLTSVKTRLPGITDEMINVELFNTLNEFFRRTNAWRFDATITLSDGVREYAMFPPNNTVLVRVLEVSHHGTAVPALQAGGEAASQRGRIVGTLQPDGDAIYDPARTEPAEPAPGNSFRYAIYFPTYIMITVPPDAEAQQHPLVAIIALSLAQGCLECDCGDWSVPDWMWDMYFEDWLDGILGRLMSMPAKPWSNVQLAQYHARRFRSAMAFRRQESRRGFVYDQPAWRFPVGGFILR